MVDPTITLRGTVLPAMTAPKRLTRSSWRALQLLTFLSLLLFTTTLYDWSGRKAPTRMSAYRGSELPAITKLGEEGPNEEDMDSNGKHPIDELMEEAKALFEGKLKEESESLEEAARVYRERRGRHPPPGFSAWYAYARKHNSPVIEYFFDQIYTDLGPFWGTEPSEIRRAGRGLKPRIEVRKGKATLFHDSRTTQQKRLAPWKNMLNDLGKVVEVPDVDVPLNSNAEPGILLPWQDVDEAISMARPMQPAVSDVITSFSPIAKEDWGKKAFDPGWIGPKPGSWAFRNSQPYWALLRPACPAGSPARKQHVLDDIWYQSGRDSVEHRAPNLLPMTIPEGSRKGYVSNWTSTSDPCQHPHLQGLHGVFVKPETMNVVQKLVPYFGAGKFSVNNDIVLPGAQEYNYTVEASNSPAEEVSWDDKESKLFWRGPATGGKNTMKNWKRFHRHRFVSMLTPAQIRDAESPSPPITLQTSSSDADTRPLGVGPASNFRLPTKNLYNLRRYSNDFAGWVGEWADAAFTDLKCDFPRYDGGCMYNNRWYDVKSIVDLEKQKKYKYTAVLDGSGGDDHGSFISKLQSGSVVLRASLFRQWWDARIVPWVHYVPIDNTFIDLYGVMEYFVGSSGMAGWLGANKRAKEGHDEQAKFIAEAGKQWASKVLRKEDMLVYVYRLVLEYARAVDDKRLRLGWVEDLREVEESKVEESKVEKSKVEESKSDAPLPETVP